ncbi:glycosyltransferase [soil metagenome]
MAEMLIIAVIYNTPKETLRFLESIVAQNYRDVKVVLIDNSEKENENFQRELRSIMPGVIYIKSPKNAGYFGGASIGLKYFLKTNELPEWIIVSNVDIVFDQPGFFELLNKLPFPENTGVVAPAIISYKWKTDSNPKIERRYSNKQMEFYRFVCTNTLTQNLYMTLSYFKKLVKGRKPAISSIENASKLIYAPHGSCILFKKSYFARGGNLDHISFLFGEEIFVGETARNLNLNTVYEPQLRVSDFEHASTGFFYSKKIAGFMKQSTLDIIEHYYPGS